MKRFEIYYIFTYTFKMSNNKICTYKYIHVLHRIEFWSFNQVIRYCVIDFRILFDTPDAVLMVRDSIRKLQYS